MSKSFANSVAKRKKRERRKNLRAGSHVGTLAAFVMDNLYMDLFGSTFSCMEKG